MPVVNESIAKQGSAPATDKSVKSVGPAAQSAAQIAPGVGTTTRAGMIGSETAIQTGGSTANIGATSSANGGAQGSTPIDQVSPPRTGRGRLIEQPVTLKLKMTPTGSSSTTQLSETEISAAEKQLGRALTAAFRQNTPQVTLWMTPETLGKVRIELSFDQGTISARFEATSQATKDLLSQNMGALRDALQSRGLTAHQIEVVSVPDWSDQSGPQSGAKDGQSSNGQLPNQSSSGGSSPFGQGGQPQQGNREHSRAWTAVSSLETTQQHSSALPEAQISLPSNPRLISLQAHLELDAVA